MNVKINEDEFWGKKEPVISGWGRVRGWPPTLFPFPILHELCEALERVILFPVQVGLDFSIEANGDTFLRQIFCDAGRASFVVVDGVRRAFVVDTGAEINARH
jgi:hypothetical protein